MLDELLERLPESLLLESPLRPLERLLFRRLLDLLLRLLLAVALRSAAALAAASASASRTLRALLSLAPLGEFLSRSITICFDGSFLTGLSRMAGLLSVWSGPNLIGGLSAGGSR